MTNIIKVSSNAGKLVVSSREIAINFEKSNSVVNRSIENLIEETSMQNCTHLFIESNYKDSYGREQKEYLLTRDGFSLLVMGFTGQKSLEWKLKYIEAFNQMEQQLKAPMQELSPQLQLLINMELKQREIEMAITETKQEVQDMRDVIKLDTTSWREDTATLVNKIAKRLGGYEHIKPIREESYKLLDQRMGVSLATRLTNKRRRMADEGASKSKRDKLNLLDVISDDKKLIEGYVAIVKEMSIKYGI